MIIGILFVIAACFGWGLIFVIPNLLAGFSPVEIALGRFLVFGLISIAILVVRKRHLLHKSYHGAWVKVFWLSLISTLVCYTCFVASVRYASPALTALICGMSPITIALFGNWVKREFPSQKLILPLFLMALGVALVNLKAFDLSGVSLRVYSFGLFYGVLGLASWTWYAVANSQFAEKNKQLSSFDSIVMLGTATFFLVIIAIGIFAAFFLDFSKYAALTPELKQFIYGSLILGTFSSLFAYFFWICGSLRLPLSLAGQLSIFEMIFGLAFIYLVEKRWPFPAEIAGIILMLLGIMTAFVILKRVSTQNASAI